MDTLSHGLAGLAVGALRRPDGGPGTGRPHSMTDRAVFWCTLIAAELPDIDVLLLPGGDLNHIRFHRSFTHSLPGVLVLVALLTLLARWRWPGARLKVVAGWSLFSMLVGHLLMDVVTSFGTQVLMPVVDTRFALDWVTDTEPLFVLPLLLAVVAGRYWPLWRRWALSAGLSLAILFLGWRGLTHQQLVGRVTADYSLREPVHGVSVRPIPWTLNRYQYVVDTPDGLHLGTVGAGWPIREERHLDKLPENDPVVAAARQDPRVRLILDFTRHPLITYRSDETGYDLFITDFRGGHLAFTFRALLNENLEVMRAFRDYTASYLKAIAP